MTEEFKGVIKNTIDRYGAELNLRLIVLAYKDLKKNEDIYQELIEDKLIKNLVFLSIIGIKDKMRDNIDILFKQFENSGVDVRITTGDNL